METLCAIEIKKMKKICTLLSIAALILSYNSQAQTYNITSNTTWSSTPACTSGCTYNISNGVTLTINVSFTCSTCTFNGGDLSITKDLTCQPCTFSGKTIALSNAMIKPNSGTTSFSNVKLAATGTASVSANTPINVTNSNFKFYNTSFFYNNGGTLNISGSSFHFYDNSYFYANAGPVNLKSSSNFIFGDGTSSSAAYIKMNGPVLNIYDNSAIALENKNNDYFNWGSYNYYASTASATHTSFSNPSAPNYYGASTLNSAGFTPGVILPVTLTGFSADYSNHTVEILWSTAQEINFDHFSIQRSNDGNNWQTIGNVQAKDNASTANNYSFDDASPLDNTNYYRLVMVDQNGKYSVSKIISVNTNETTSQVSIFPNPVINSTVNVKLPSNEAAVINVFTMEGRLLFATALKGQSQYQISLPVTTRNTYLVVQVISNGKTNAFNVLSKS